MPRRCGQVTEITVEADWASFEVARPDGASSARFSLYASDPGAALTQAEVLRRSGTLALLGRAFSDGAFVAVYARDDDHSIPRRIVLTKELWDDDDTKTSILLAVIEVAPPDPIKLPPP